jgi:transcriptional regulator with XRE-family HTH domain
MNMTLSILDEWKSKKRISTDLEAAKQLGVTRAAISNWRQMLSEANVASIAKMAQDIGLDPIKEALKMESIRAKEPSVKKFWESAIKYLEGINPTKKNALENLDLFDDLSKYSIKDKTPQNISRNEIRPQLRKILRHNGHHHAHNDHKVNNK